MCRLLYVWLSIRLPFLYYLNNTWQSITYWQKLWYISQVKNMNVVVQVVVGKTLQLLARSTKSNKWCKLRGLKGQCKSSITWRYRYFIYSYSQLFWRLHCKSMCVASISAHGEVASMVKISSTTSSSSSSGIFAKCLGSKYKWEPLCKATEVWCMR